MVQVVAADREGVAIAAEDEDVQIGPGKGDSAGKGQGATVNIMGAVGLNEIRKAAGAANAGDGGDFFVPKLSLFDQFEIKGEHREIPATRTPGRMVGRDVFLGQGLSF